MGLHPPTSSLDRDAARSSRRPSDASARAEARAQLVLPHLAGRVARQLVEQLELLGDLLPHDAARLHEGAHLGERRARRRPGAARRRRTRARRCRRRARRSPRRRRPSGCAASSSSMPLAERFSPLRMMMSLRRPVMRMKPSASMTREVAGAEEAVGGEGGVQRRVEVADAELRSVGLDLALDARRDRPARLVDEPRDAARARAGRRCRSSFSSGRRAARR